jgi:Ca2+-dependent lipid-binding protein
LKGQDILHVDVYDADFILDDRIGSVQINLQDLYEKGFEIN